jgi:hypothetical protein
MGETISSFSYRDQRLLQLIEIFEILLRRYSKPMKVYRLALCNCSKCSQNYEESYCYPLNKDDCFLSTQQSLEQLQIDKDQVRCGKSNLSVFISHLLPILQESNDNLHIQ